MALVADQTLMPLLMEPKRDGYPRPTRLRCAGGLARLSPVLVGGLELDRRDIAASRGGTLVVPVVTDDASFPPGTQAAMAAARILSSVAISSSTSDDANSPSGPRGVRSVNGDS